MCETCYQTVRRRPLCRVWWIRVSRAGLDGLLAAASWYAAVSVSYLAPLIPDVDDLF